MSSRQTPRQTARGLILSVGLLLLAALLPPTTPWAGTLIFCLTLSGYGAVLATLYLFVSPLRLRQFMPGGALPLTEHRRIGTAALILTLLHSVGYLVAEPTTWSELSPAAPLFMLAGLAALIILLLLSVTSRHDPRLRLSRSRWGFRGLHLILSMMLLLLMTMHIGAAGLALDAPWKNALWALLAALAMAGLLRRALHGKAGAE